MHRVLVIDDNPDMRELLKVMLERAGYAVDLAADGMAGLQAQRTRPAELVITDIFMPDQDGIETIANFREQFPEAKVLVVSGGGRLVRSQSHLLTAREMGANAFLPKPFDHDELLTMVSRLLR